ncbi:MarR family winged helix-turn-helix transcriptional regulator [Actinomadura rudentiformis]|uniref:MarR family transcriptional regulator n=1 Tax=Actinomadura rudentiformis TaxID=359158 RepID=A0A6H9YX82_9ACTN|nr:MarR family transcriptional regulator [Actinomadura rudentiformis]KAB2350835.1 MarR family transcriptional regulator [Actinomadura rudentiformis]
MNPEPELVGRWRNLAACYNQVACHLDRELQAQHGLSMSEFEALDRLIGLQSEKCRMQELASDMYLSQSALSRTVARLEKHGLVQRGLCEADRRGVFVKPTEAGIELHAKARETHLTILSEHLSPSA